MKRKRLTQMFPFLLSFRKWERKKLFYLSMKLDFHHYATTKMELFSYPLFEAKTKLINEKTGYPLMYQKNKVYNLRLAASKLDRIVIRPGEVFSFWQLIGSISPNDYRNGLCVIDGKMISKKGGGLCQLSNTLMWLFLHTPLTMIERHPHMVKDFPNPDLPSGVDATVQEGWCDLKVKNETRETFQLVFTFDDVNMYASIYTCFKHPYSYEVVPENLVYEEVDGKVYESVLLYQRRENLITNQVETKFLYQNRCEITYPVS